MKLTKFNFATITLIVLVILNISGNLIGNSDLSNYSWMAIFPLVSFLYYALVKNRNHFFGFFLIGFSLVEILNFVMYSNGFDPKLSYYCSNVLAILSYASLVIYLVKDINFKQLVKEFKLYLVTLIIFNSYVIYVLNQMILQDETVVINSLSFAIEVTYNILVLLILSISLLHFLYHQTKKELLVFLASVCIVFSEMIQVAYLFISSELLLEVVYTLLICVGVYFFYEYIKLNSIVSKNQSNVV